MSKLDLNLVWKMIRLQALITPTTVKQDKEVQKELIKIKAENIDHLVEQSYWFTDYSVRGRYDNLEHYKICTTAESASDILTQVVYHSEINKLHKKYPNLSYFLIMQITQNKHLYINYRTSGCVYEYLETFSTGNMQIKSLEIIRLNYVKYGILFEKTIKFLSKNNFDSCTIERIRSFILAFNPSCKLGKGADKLFVIYKKLTTNLSYSFDNLVRYLKDKPYILKTSYKEFRNFLEGFLWLFPNRNDRKIKFDCTDISPSFIYVIGKLSTDLRWAAIYDRYSRAFYQVTRITNSNELKKYILSKHDINWECVKEVQSLRLEGKMRLLNNHPCFPKARGFIKQHGFHISSRNIPDTVNVKALNLIKSNLDLDNNGEYLEDCVKLANIFGMEITKVLEKLNKEYAMSSNLGLGCVSCLNDVIHAYVNENKIMNIKDALPQQWNQFFYNNPELTQYAHHVSSDQPLFKSAKEFLIWVRNKKYTGTEGFDSLVDVCARNNLDQDQFDLLKSYISKGTNKTSEMLPFVRIDGSTIPEVGHQYIIEKLDSNDPLALIIGVETDCCQHIQGVGKPCAIHSWEQSDSAIYVLRKNGQVIAQSWAWRNTRNGVVFDSIEAKRGIDTDKAGLMFKALADALIGKLMIDEAYIGNTCFGVTRIISDKHRIRTIPSETTMISPCSYMDGKTHTLFAEGVW